MQVKTRFGTQALFCSTLLLAACGGDGGGDGGGGPGPTGDPQPPAQGRGFYTYVTTKVDGPDTIRIYEGDTEVGEMRTVGSMAAGGDNPVGVAVARNTFVYVANNGIEPRLDDPATPATNEAAPGNPGSVSAYSINATTGNLTLIGNVTGVNYPTSVTVAPNGNFVYVPNFEGQSVSAFRIEANGALTSVGNASTNFGGLNGVGPAQVVFTPNGQFAYSANKQSGNAGGQGTVTVFSVAADGRLTPIQNIAAGIDPISLAVDPNGRSLYVANNVLPDDPSTAAIENRNGTVTMLPIGTDGRLGAGTQYTAASLPQYVLVDPNGSAVYVANSGSNSVSVFNRDATTGALTPRTALSVGTSPWGMGLTPNGRYMYVANSGVDGGISPFALGAAGSDPRGLSYAPAPGANAVASTGVLR